MIFSPSLHSSSISFPCPSYPPNLHSFPTRRSSDLLELPRRVRNQRGLLERRVRAPAVVPHRRDRKSTRLNSSHRCISYAVFCLKKKKARERHPVDPPARG